MNAEQIIKQVFGGWANPLTPEVLEYGWAVDGRLAYELSTDGTEYAVTIVQVDPPQYLGDLSDVFETEQAARLHIERIRKRETLQLD